MKHKHIALTKKLKPSTAGYQYYIIQVRGKIPSESPTAAKRQIFDVMEGLVEQIPGAEILHVGQPRLTHNGRKRDPLKIGVQP